MLHTVSIKREVVGAPVKDYPTGSARFDWIAAALSAWVIGGAYLDGWAHNHGRVDDVFFTPWHGVLYSGVLALLAFLLFHQWQKQSRGHVWRRALPKGYGLSLFGAGLFIIGGGLDLFWHTLFGVEVSIEALLSPTHLLLATGGVLMISGPIRAAWSRIVPDDTQGWQILGPMIFSLTLVLSLLSFFTQFAHPIKDTYAARDPGIQDPHSDIYVMNADGTAQTRLTISSQRGGWGPAWSPDGRRIAFTLSSSANPKPELYLMNADGTGSFQLTQNQRTNYLPAWSPDGKQIAFISQSGGNINTAEVYVINADGSNEARLTDTNSQEYGVSWSPDGAKLAFGSKRDGTWQLYVMKRDGSNQQVLTTGGGGNAPVWSPDGKRIAFTSDRYGNDDIFVVDVDGSHLRRLTDNDAHDDNPAWSPEGSRIVFSSDRDGRENIFAMNADGSEARNLTQDSGRWTAVPSWSPDGMKVLYTTQGDSPRPSWLVQPLGLASILLQTAFLMGAVLLVVRRWTLPFGALTVVITGSSALMSVLQDRYVLLPAVLLSGLLSDLLLRWLKPSQTGPVQFHLFAFAVPVIFYSLYFLNLQLTQGIAWTVHLWLGAIVMAGVIGLFIGFLLISPLNSEVMSNDLGQP